MPEPYIVRVYFALGYAYVALAPITLRSLCVGAIRYSPGRGGISAEI